MVAVQLGWPVTKLLWGSSLSPSQLQMVQVLSDVSANACVWLAAAALRGRCQRVRARTRANAG